MTLNWSSQYAPVDDDFSDVSLLLLGEGTNGSTTITDSSSNNLSVSAVDNAQISTAVNTPFGTGDGVLAFDGTGDYLSIANASSVDFGTDLFTVEAWIYQTQSVTTYAQIFTSNGSNNSGIGFTVDSSQGLAIYFSGFRVPVTSTKYPLNQWNHVAYVREPNNVLKVYINGSVAGTGTIQGAAPVFDDVRVGINPDSSAEVYRGYISNLRITKGVARYTKNFDVPTAPFPILSPSGRVTIADDNLDADARQYIINVEEQDGEPLEDSVRTAINTFVVGCKSDGIWNAIKSSCIMAGARTLDGALVPLKGGAPTNNNFVAGDYNRKTGLVGNQVDKSLDCNRNNVDDPQDNRHVSVYASTLPTSATRPMLGIAAPNQSGSTNIYNTTTRLVSAASSFTASSNFTGLSRNASGSYTRRTGGVNSSVLDVSNTPVNATIELYRDDSTWYGNPRLSFYSIGESLDLALLDNRISTLMTTLDTVLP